MNLKIIVLLANNAATEDILMKAKIILENGISEEFWIADKDMELLERSAQLQAQIMGEEESSHNAAREIAYGIIPWGIDRIRKQENGIRIGWPEGGDENAHEGQAAADLDAETEADYIRNLKAARPGLHNHDVAGISDRNADDECHHAEGVR